MIDPQLHNDLKKLVDWGYLELSTSSYPVPWKGIKPQLSILNNKELPPIPAAAVARLNQYLLTNHNQKSQRFISIYSASDNRRFKNFGALNNNRYKLNANQTVKSEKWAGRLSIMYDQDSQIHFDGSYLMYRFDHWNIHLGAIDQWWGPAQSSSLILSTNARPIPVVAFSRNTATASKEPVLSFLGPWYFTAQLGQLESSRDVANTKIWRSRFTAKPIKGLEIAASWSAMWGGEGLGNSLEDFWDVLTFKPQCANGANNCDGSLNTKKGNHLAGFDINYTFTLWQRPMSVYAQRIGEDAADYINITDQATLFGASSYIWGAKIYLESSNTNVSCGGPESPLKNCFYEHGEYTSGYRYYQRAIGSTFDSDAKMLTAGLNKRLENGDIFELSILRLTLNPDQQKPSPVVNANTESLYQLSGFYQTNLANAAITLGAQLESNKVDEQKSSFSALVYASVNYRF